jgi:phenylalanyl-tRNA synthetase beta chain
VNESVSHDAVIAAIRSVGSPWLRDAVLFDVYRPKKGAPAGSLAADEKSLAVRLVLNRDDATLTEDDIEATVKAVLDALQQRVAARLRA